MNGYGGSMGSLGEEGGARLVPCLGLGVVRAVDGRRRVIQVLSGLGEEELELVDVLQLTALRLPPELLRSGPLVSPYLALDSLSHRGVGARHVGPQKRPK